MELVPARGRGQEIAVDSRKYQPQVNKAREQVHAGGKNQIANIAIMRVRQAGRGECAEVGESIPRAAWKRRLFPPGCGILAEKQVALADQSRQWPADPGSTRAREALGAAKRAGFFRQEQLATPAARRVLEKATFAPQVGKSPLPGARTASR